MKRKLLALGVLAALATPVCADYLVIRINLSPEAHQPSGDRAGNDATRPNTGGLGFGGRGAGGLGGGTGGDAATGGAAMGGKGGGGMAAGGGGLPGGGRGGVGGGRGGVALGGTGGQPPRGGAGGAAPPSPVGAGGRPPGGAGVRPGQPGGAPSPVGAGGVGAGGGGEDAVTSGGGGGARGGVGQQSNEPADLAPTKEDLFIVATEVTVAKNRTSNKVTLTTKWGTTVLDPETSLPGKATMQVIKTPSLADRLSQARRDFVDGQSNKDYMKLAEWMLQNWNLPDGKMSMHEKFDAFLTELTSVAPT